jgi:hypothetical protein
MYSIKTEIRITLMLIGLNQTQKTPMPQEENGMGKDSYVLKQTHFSVNNVNAVALKYFDFRTSAVWLFRKAKSCPRTAK